MSAHVSTDGSAIVTGREQDILLLAWYGSGLEATACQAVEEEDEGRVESRGITITFRRRRHRYLSAGTHRASALSDAAPDALSSRSAAPFREASL